MAEQLIISVSGMRGIVGRNLTESVAADYGRAFGTFLIESHAEKKGQLSRLERQINRSEKIHGPVTEIPDQIAKGLIRLNSERRLHLLQQCKLIRELLNNAPTNDKKEHFDKEFTILEKVVMEALKSGENQEEEVNHG